MIAASVSRFDGLRAAGWGLVVPVAILLLWESLGSIGKLPPFLSTPDAVLSRGMAMLLSGELWSHATASLWLVGAGFAIGAAGGIVIGLLAGVFRPVEIFYEPLVSLTYPVPKIAFLPLIFAWFGLGSGSKILVIATSVFYPCYIAAYYGAKSTRSVHIWSARNMGASSARTFFRVVLPSALPQIFSGLRIAVALSFILMVTSELVVSNKGLGYLIARADESHRFDVMFVSIAVIGLFGFGADRLLLAVRRRMLVGQMLGKDQADD